MDGGKFLLLSGDCGFLREQTEIEGLNGYFVEAFQFPQDLSEYDLIVINRFALTKKLVRSLLDYTAKGKTVLAIKPCENLERAICIRKDGVQPKGWLRGDSDDDIFQVFDIAKYKAQHILYPLLNETGELTDYALISWTPVGSGRVFIFAFDFSQTLFSLLQGRDLLPNENDPFGIPRVDFGRLVEVNKRFTPQADGLRRIFISLIEDNISFPIPKMWYFPNGIKGGIACTHDSDASKGPDFERVNSLNSNMGVNATTFMKIGDGSPSCWKRLVDKGIDLQFHPILNLRQPAIIRKRLKKFTFHFPTIFKKLSFLFQKRLLEIFSTQRIVGVRNHGLAWPKMIDYFNWMSRLGISYDSTLGSNHYFGYMYGTGFPYFLRLPGTFKNMDILEFPLHIMDSVFIKGYGREWQNGESFSRIKTFIKQSIEQNNSLITLNFHYFFLLNKDPRLNNLELYKKILEYVQHENIPIINLSELNIFWRKRLNLKVVDTLWNKSEGKLTFGIKSKENIDGLTYLLPMTFKEGLLLESTGESMQSIVQNGKKYKMYQVDIRANSSHKVIAQYSNN